MKRITGAIILMVLISTVLAAGCTSAQPRSGYASIRNVDLVIPDGQPLSNVTEIVVSPYIDAMYTEIDDVELQVSAKEYGTNIVVAETTASIGNLAPGSTRKEPVTLRLANGKRYDIWVTVWQGGRMQEKGSVEVYLPDRTIPDRQHAYSMLSINGIDVMTPDIDADPITLDIITDITNGGQNPSGALSMEIKLVNLQTGITAVRESRSLSSIAASAHAERRVSVTVPNGYDYTVSIKLIENGAPFASSAGRVTLAPPPQVVFAGGQPGVVLNSAISTPGGVSTGLPVPTATPTPYSAGAQVGQFRIQSSGASVPTATPGFGAVLACAGILGALFVLTGRRR